MILSDLERRDTRVKLFWRISVNYAKFDTVAQMVEKRVLKGLATPLSQGGGAPAFRKIGDPTYAHTIWPRATKFGVKIHVGAERVPGGQPRWLPKGRGQGHSAYIILGASYMLAHVATTTFCTVIKIDVRKVLTCGSPRMMTRDRFAVANLLHKSRKIRTKYPEHQQRTKLTFSLEKDVAKRTILVM